MNLAITCALGLESLARKEVERLGFPVLSVADRLVRFSGGFPEAARANLWSRVGSRVWVELASGPASRYEDVFSIVSSVDWARWVPAGAPVLVTATPVRSTLEGESALQSLGKKAVMSRLSAGADGRVFEDAAVPAFHVELLLVAAELRVLADTTGPDALHKRGYRTEAGEAPLKESLAAGLVQLAGWSFREPFRDPFCGTGTIAIEAAMYAANVAPGLNRAFAFEEWPSCPEGVSDAARAEARAARMEGKAYDISASDADPVVIGMARAAAERAGVADLVKFSVADFAELSAPLSGALVTNPPYGIRMGGNEDLSPLYRRLAELFRKSPGLDGGVLTAWEGADRAFAGWKGRKFRVGGQEARFWRPKGR